MAVSNYAEGDGVNYLFHNRGNEHALIILSNIFRNAKSHIRIAANRLYNDEVVNTKEYIDSMKTFLDREGSLLSILITKRPTIEEVQEHGPENTFYWMLYNHPAYRQGRVTIKEGEGNSFKDADGNQVDFCTGDDRMFRMEQDVKERQAIANFRDPAYTGQLIKVFDEVYPRLNSVVKLGDYYQIYQEK